MVLRLFTFALARSLPGGQRAEQCPQRVGVIERHLLQIGEAEARRGKHEGRLECREYLRTISTPASHLFGRGGHFSFTNTMIRIKPLEPTITQPTQSRVVR